MGCEAKGCGCDLNTKCDMKSPLKSNQKVQRGNDDWCEERREVFAFVVLLLMPKSVLPLFLDEIACAPSTPSNLINVSLTKFSKRRRIFVGEFREIFGDGRGGERKLDFP